MQKEEIMDKEINIDLQSRKRIVEELDKNFFVEASAGSGKTTSLVYRMVALIENGVPVDKICTITFTKAAADEFFNRFQSLLSTRSILKEDKTDKFIGKKDINTVKRCQEALNNIDSCFMGTIDSFCNMIAHELPSELGIPSNSEVVNDEDYLKIVQKEYLQILKDKDHPLHDKAIRFKNLIYKDMEGLSFGVNEFLQMRHTKIVYDDSLVNVDVDEYFSNDKEWLLNVIKNLTSEGDVYNLSSKAGKERLKAQNALRNKYRFLKNKPWKDNLNNLFFALKGIFDLEGFNENALGTDIEQYLDLPEKITKSSTLKYLETFKDEVNNISTKLNEYKYQIYCDFINEISRLMESEFKDLGKFQFFDFLYYLNEAFKESEKGNRELINHILERHSHFLLDESQDTNPLQTEMFFHLTGTVYDEDWKKVKPKEGSLFIVGDPKQSIYSFRDANVSAYLNNKSRFEDNTEALYLTRNFRSNVALKNWFNKTMDDLLNHDLEALEHPIIPIPEEEIKEEIIPSDVIDGVYKYYVDKKDDGEYLAQLILSLVGKQKIYSRNLDSDTPKKKARLIKYSDFMIVPITTNVINIVTALKKYHIPLTIEARIPFDSSESLMVMKDLLLLLKAPQDINKFLNVVHGKLYKLTDKDILTLKNSGFDLNIAHPADIDNLELDKIIKELNALYSQTLGMSYSSTMLYIINNKALNIFKNINASNFEYTLFLIQKIKEKEEDGSLVTVAQLEEFINDFLNNNDNQRSLRFKDKLDRVKISNVHKVKGLQAPIVILAKPSQNENEPTKYVDFSYLPPHTYFSKFSYKDDRFIERVFAETSQFDDQLPIWKSSQKAEKERLEYVAATRAESVLIVGKVETNKINPWADLYNKIKGNEDNNCDIEVENLEPTKLEKEDISLGTFNINEKSHDLTHKYVSPSQMRVNKINNNNDEIDDASFDKEDSSLLGTLVHRVMELIVSSQNRYDSNDLINKVFNEYHFDQKYKSLLVGIINKIRNGGFNQKNSLLDNDILKTLLSMKRVWCETPFAYLSKDNNIVSGVIDVLYLDHNDKYHIIDYKTNDEDDVSILEKEYENQLTGYKYALRKMGIEADVHIYHIDIKENKQI